MTLNCYKFKFSLNFALFRIFGRQQRLNEWRLKIDPHRQRTRPSLLLTINRKSPCRMSIGHRSASEFYSYLLIQSLRCSQVRNPRPKLQSLLSQEQSYGLQIWLVHTQSPSEQKPMKNFREKAAGKAANFKFCVHIHRIDRNKTPIKNFGKSSPWAYSGTLENFQGTHRAHRAVVFAVAQLSY